MLAVSVRGRKNPGREGGGGALSAGRWPFGRGLDGLREVGGALDQSDVVISELGDNARGKDAGALGFLRGVGLVLFSGDIVGQEEHTNNLVIRYDSPVPPSPQAWQAPPREIRKWLNAVSTAWTSVIWRHPL